MAAVTGEGFVNVVVSGSSCITVTGVGIGDGTGVGLDVGPGDGKDEGRAVGSGVGSVVGRKVPIVPGSTLTLSSDVVPAWDANVSIEDARAPEEIAAVTSLLTLPSTSSSCWLACFVDTGYMHVNDRSERHFTTHELQSSHQQHNLE